jgi:hypothetical protein
MLIVGRAFSIAFLVYTVVMILRDLLMQRVVTWDSLVGSFCGYLLIGVTWSEMYALLQLISPGALHFEIESTRALASQANTWQHFQYFSFVTLSTVGYGDITPVSPTARALAMMEAICGQFYLAVLVAALVGLRVSSRQADRRESQP